ncbi:MAG: sodium:proton antiporter [Salinisphaeraceae bacterium]|jgi:multicomponent Na+:H+ antiporter subunit G|nr:sodium:proton antiporter [Salinisphaeraceae bacterium]
MDVAAYYLSWLLLSAGGLLAVIGGIGTFRMPDLYTRMHAASVTDTGGMLLIMAGLLVQAGLSLVSFKLLLIVFFLLFTSPVATHALARAALHEGHKPRLGPGAGP